jgi:hypothetical protein
MRFLFLLTALLPMAAHASNSSGLNFSQDEIATSAKNAQVIADTSAQCLKDTWTEHVNFYKANGYSKFYGDRKKEYQTVDGRRAAILRILPNLAKKVRANDPAAIAELARRVGELENSSCVELAMKCTKKGFEAGGLGATWDRIYSWLGRPDSTGTPMYDGDDILKALADLGWSTLYWNPDVSENEQWDLMDRTMNPVTAGRVNMPVWGFHQERWVEVLRHHDYFNIPVTDIQTLVNFGIQPPADFTNIPFFIGTAHAGYHVFSGFAGTVLEGHSTRDLSSRDNMQIAPFNPLNQAANGVAGAKGAPQWTNSEHYRSGVIAVPPGMIAPKGWVTPSTPRNVPPAIDPIGSQEPNYPNDPGYDPNYPNQPQWPSQPQWPNRPQPQPHKCFFIFCRH